jgi:uncharacterized protein (UPF0264 family)
MTKLLISVRSAAEARIACQAGADLIDVKEPARGSLGAADSKTIGQIVRQVGGRRPVSVALGELVQAAALSRSLAGRVQYAKFGLAGCAEIADWALRWSEAIARLPQGVTPVAVVYADWRTAAAPDPASVLGHALPLRCGAVLLDTFDKSRGPLTNYLGPDKLGEFIAAAGDAGLLSVVAGGLGLVDVAWVARLMPDYIAVRGAACLGPRWGRLDGDRVRRLANVLRRTEVSDGPRRPPSSEVPSNRQFARFTAGLSD